MLFFPPHGQDSDKCYPLRIIPPCSNLSVIVCTFPFGLKVKWIIRKIRPHHKGNQEGYRALKLSVFIKFWTLYKGKCLRICDNFANPQWIEIYLNFFFIVCTKTCAIGVCVRVYVVFLLQVYVYIDPLFKILYIGYIMQIELFLYRKKYMGIVAICHYSFANCGNRIYVL